MKTKTFLAALLLMVGTNLMADDYNFLILTTNGSEQSLPLPIVQRITFEDGYVVVQTTESKHAFPIALLDKITFAETADGATAIKNLPEQAENLTFKDGTLVIKGDGMLRVYNTSGAIVSIAYVKEGANVSFDSLPAGVYIVRMGDKTIKVRK